MCSPGNHTSFHDAFSIMLQLLALQGSSQGVEISRLHSDRSVSGVEAARRGSWALAAAVFQRDGAYSAHSSGAVPALMSVFSKLRLWQDSLAVLREVRKATRGRAVLISSAVHG